MAKGLRNKIGPFLTSLTQPNPFWKAYSSPSWWLQLFKRRRLKTKDYRLKTNDSPIYVIFTCDLELDPPWNKESWEEQTSFGLEQGTPILLNLLKRYKIKATFFCEGRLAKTHPHLIKELKDEDHEIGCHGWAHEGYGGHYRLDRFLPRIRVLKMSEKREYILKAKKGLEELTGTEVVSFRAPFLMIDSSTMALLDELGFLVDSSLYNILFGRIRPYHPKDKNFLREGNLKIVEIPISINPVPRLLPHYPYGSIYSQEAVKFAFNSSNLENIPTIILLMVHPWEFVEIENPPGILIGERRTELLDEFLKGLLILDNLQFVTISQMARIWEDEHCPFHT